MPPIIKSAVARFMSSILLRLRSNLFVVKMKMAKVFAQSIAMSARINTVHHRMISLVLDLHSCSSFLGLDMFILQSSGKSLIRKREEKNVLLITVKSSGYM